MFRDNKQYTLHWKNVGGFIHYYIAFTDEQGETHDTHVTRNVFAAYMRFEKDERNLRRWDERHREHRVLSGAEINARALRQPHSIEKLIIDAEQREALEQAIAELPEIQRRRLLMHHEGGLSFVAIAEREGCSGRAVQYSVNLAEGKIRKNLKKFEN
ncbi:MAG: sigma-70 family RNA polymerase sigma factor [Oscillospiraceae bacterium]|nr:sigma-70 family RNA polymerase sigma factor [Oscillospiraceae bacterium]